VTPATTAATAALSRDSLLRSGELGGAVVGVVAEAHDDEAHEAQEEAHEGGDAECEAECVLLQQREERLLRRNVGGREHCFVSLPVPARKVGSLL
jgi:hypothetical protein